MDSVLNLFDILLAKNEHCLPLLHHLDFVIVSFIFYFSQCLIYDYYQQFYSKLVYSLTFNLLETYNRLLLVVFIQFFI